MIKTIGLTKKIGSRVLYRSADLSISDGEMVAFLGESGCGKTTLLNLLSLLDPQYEGEILIGGVDYKKVSKGKREKQRSVLFSYIFSQDYLLDYLTPRENIVLLGKEAGRSVPDSLWQEMDDFGLTPLLDGDTKTLSPGERQRISAFRAIALGKKYLICDEPSAHLDHANSEKLFALLSTQKKKGSTIIVSLHDKSMLSYFDEAYQIANDEITKIA